MQDESSIAAHLGERAARTADAESAAPDNGDNAESVADEDVPDQTGSAPLSLADDKLYC